MKYVYRVPSGWLSLTPPPPPACHHCNLLTEVASPDTLFRAQEAVSLSLQVQPTSFYISTRPPVPASALLWLSNPVPTRDRWRTALWFEPIWMVESGGDWRKFGTHQILNCLKKKQKPKQKTPSCECEPQWCVTALGSSSTAAAKPNASATLYSFLGAGYKFQGPYRNGCLSQLHYTSQGKGFRPLCPWHGSCPGVTIGVQQMYADFMLIGCLIDTWVYWGACRTMATLACPRRSTFSRMCAA